MKKFLVLTICILFLSISFVHADIIPAGHKSVDYCFEISNSHLYDDYFFVVVFDGPPISDYKIISQNECIRFYYHSSPKIFAIRKTVFDENELSKALLEKGEDVQPSSVLRNINGYISSDITINSVSTVPSYSPIEKIIDVIEIIGLSENDLSLRKARVIYYYENGYSESTNYNGDMRPAPSETGLSHWLFIVWFIIIPILSIILVLTIILSRKSKK